MATVTVAFSPLPAHVRTARFISVSVARRAGVAENVLDEIRLAVSEACSLAVRLHLTYAPAEPVELRLTEETDEFRVEVVDAVGGRRADEGAAPKAGSGVSDYDEAADLDRFDNGLEATVDDSGELVDLRARERIGLAVIAGLVDEFSVDYRDSSSVITMSWPITHDGIVPVSGQ